ncbi:MAG: ATP synthase F1 subunit gamma [Bryobacteraceae bacterium]
MPSLIDLRRRIRSVKNTEQVTKAMKMISAAKLRRAQDRVIAARPYASIFRQMLAQVAAAVADDEESLGSHPLLARRPEARILAVLVTGDRGLAGAFNSNLIRGTQEFLRQHADADVRLFTIGRKGHDFFRKRGSNVVGARTGISQSAAYGDAAAIAREVCERFEKGEADSVYVIFNEFKSVMTQRFTISRVLPLEVPSGADAQAGADYIFEQPPGELMRALLPRYVEISFYQALLESAAAEHAARMTAMEAATSNAGEMIDKLTLYMNRVRQASITKELIEVVSGAAAQT